MTDDGRVRHDKSCAGTVKLYKSCAGTVKLYKSCAGTVKLYKSCAGTVIKALQKLCWHNYKSSTKAVLAQLNSQTSFWTSFLANLRFPVDLSFQHGTPSTW